VVHLNEIKGGAAATAHLLEFDSVQGRWRADIQADDAQTIRINDKTLGFSSYATSAEIPWGDYGVDVVLECTGKFLTPETIQGHLERGAKRVIVAAPVKVGNVLNIVVGVNDHLYDPAQYNIVTAASCTTNCLAPVVKVIHESIGIRHGQITTIHDPTNTNQVVDAPHKDLRRARAASLSLIPTTTGSATAIGLIFPELQGKLDGLAVRVPLLNSSLTDCVFEVERATTVEEVNALLRAASETGALQGILGYEERPLVSIDYKTDPRSSIVDALSTRVINGTQVKIYAWYDNEYGYAHRFVDVAVQVAAAM
jgi:glyceraldehyde 3-phosphate dehydrogenase